MPDRFKNNEVINAGVPWGTSAELLTHYHFKFHYYNPDIVAIMTGANDAEANTRPFYHPDYSYWRQPVINLRAVRGRGRWMMHSRLFSLLLLNLFFDDFIQGQHFVQNREPLAPWFSGEIQSIPDGNLGFTHNLSTLIREIKEDGSEVILLPPPLNPFPNPPSGPVPPDIFTQIERHKEIMRKIAEKLQVEYSPFPEGHIPEGNWVDWFHVDGIGSRLKAEHVASSILKLLRIG